MRKEDTGPLPFNFRDVGVVTGLMPQGKIIRCGHICLGKGFTWTQLGEPKTIINLITNADDFSDCGDDSIAKNNVKSCQSID